MSSFLHSSQVVLRKYVQIWVVSIIHFSFTLKSDFERWLSRTEVLTRLFELHDELKIFLSGQNIPTFAGRFELLDKQQLIKLAYIANIFGKLNEITKSLQGKATTTFMVRDKIK